MKRFLAAAFLALPLISAADPDPSVMSLKREADIVWSSNPRAPGLEFALLYGDLTRPGPYVVRVRFAPGTMSPPHFHPEERQIVVLMGTWWAGSGPKFDKGDTVPMAAGSFVVHYPNKVHYDGAKDEEVIVQISGIGSNKTILVDELGNPR